MSPAAAYALNVLYVVVLGLRVHTYQTGLTIRIGVPRRASLARRAIALIVRSAGSRRPNGGRHRRPATTHR